MSFIYIIRVSTYRARLSVVLWDGVIDIDENTRFLRSTKSISCCLIVVMIYISCIYSWDSNKWAWSAASAISDLYLTTREVELGSSEGTSRVQSNGFHADQISMNCVREAKAMKDATYCPDGRLYGTVKDTPGRSE